MNTRREFFVGTVGLMAIPSVVKAMTARPNPLIDHSIVDELGWNATKGLHTVFGPCGSGRTSLALHATADQLLRGKRVTIAPESGAITPDTFLLHYVRSGQLQVMSSIYKPRSEFFNTDVLIIDNPAFVWTHEDYRKEWVYRMYQEGWSMLLFAASGAPPRIGSGCIHVHHRGFRTECSVSDSITRISQGGGIVNLYQTKRRDVEPGLSINCRIQRNRVSSGPQVRFVRV